jgi:hypothetical protein
LWSNDRFWLAVDHTVDPRINDQAKPKKLIELSEGFAKEVGDVPFGPKLRNNDILPSALVCGEY